jgi:hypothetical protein
VRLAAHLLDRFVERHALDGGAVDAGDQVAGLDAGLEGGRVLDRRDHLDVAVFQRHFDADADELAGHGLAHFAEGFLVEVDRVRVERGHHAGDGLGQQLLVVDVFDVVGLDQAKHVGQLAQFFQRQRAARDFLRDGGKLERGGNTSHHAEADQADVLDFVAHFSR